MSDLPFAPSALLAHESFVRAIVRGVLRDVHAVEDVLQETWTVALEGRRGAGVPVRAWLAGLARHRALQRVRADGRRARREARAAVPESTADSVSASEERLELRTAVVRAVLALDEPFRTVVLLRYEQGLSPAEIAARTGVSAATVRKQLSRAHARLRDALDAHDPERRWALLAGPGSVTAAGAVGLGLALAAGLVAVATLGGGPSTQRPAQPSLTALAVAQAGRTADSPSSHIPVEGDDVRELRDFAVQVQREVTRRALAVPERFSEAEAELLAEPGTGLARLLYRGSPLARQVLKREGGAYFSFATRDHSYDRQPDLELTNDGSLGGGFYGGRFGAVLALGAQPLASLPTDGAAPDGLAPEDVPAWEFLNGPIGDPPQQAYSSWWASAGRTPAAWPQAEEGRTYVVRTASTDEQDHLVGFRVLERDDEGVVIAWRVLRTWSMRFRNVPVSGEFRDVPPASEERSAAISALGDDGLDDLLARIRRRAGPLLWSVPEELKVEWTRAVGARQNFAQREGFTRLLHRGEFGPLVVEEGGGCAYSFTAESHDWQAGPQLALGNGMYETGLQGSGWIVDLGALAFEDLRSALEGRVPEALDGDTMQRVAFLRAVRADDAKGRVSKGDVSLARTLGLEERVTAQLGHSYLVRALGDRADVLVLVTTLVVDDVGHTLAWRLLESYPVR